MSMQIEIGLSIAEFARDEIAAGKDAEAAFSDLIRQCLRRDAGWKAFYAENMESVEPKGANKLLLNIYVAELEAEKAFIAGDFVGATKRVQKLLDEHKLDSADLGWYLQMMGRFNYPSDRVEFARLQQAAHTSNHMVMRPQQGLVVAKLSLISQGRVERIADWIKAQGDYTQLDITLNEILGRLVFGVKADKFEQALDELSRALGFAGERPDKEWKEGPPGGHPNSPTHGHLKFPHPDRASMRC